MDTAQEIRIYKSYRATLTSGTRSSHAAQRRQHVRQVTVDRYKVPFAEVKRIVAEQDAIHGITHEHGEDYKEQLRYEEAVKNFKAAPHPCDCGNTENVRVRTNPFEAEINERIVYMVSCNSCYFALAEEI